MRKEWLQRLPETIREIERRWSLTIGSPFADASCAWVAPVTLRDGSSAVLKVGMPHMEARDEIRGLRFWNGEPTARLFYGDEHLDAMLLERCEPGTPLRGGPEPKQDRIIATLLRRLWRLPPAPRPFRPLSVLMEYWTGETQGQDGSWPGATLVRDGLRLFETLPRSASSDLTLATDLHAGNVLRAAREPWLVIDPKPFVGDPAYDATQHLLNCLDRLRVDPFGTIGRFADLIDVDRDRVRLWLFARLAAEPRDDWNDGSVDLARALSGS